QDIAIHIGTTCGVDRTLMAVASGCESGFAVHLCVEPRMRLYMPSTIAVPARVAGKPVCSTIAQLVSPTRHVSHRAEGKDGFQLPSSTVHVARINDGTTFGSLQKFRQGTFRLQAAIAEGNEIGQSC